MGLQTLANLTRKGFVVLALTGLLMACGSKDDKDEIAEPAELVKFDHEVKLKTLWTKSIGDGQGKKYNRLEPVLDGDNIYVAESGGNVYALDRKTGAKLWRAKLKVDLTGGVGVGSNRVFVGTPSGELIALDQDTGEKLWQQRVGGELLAPADSAQYVVVVQTFDGQLVGLNARTGEQMWEYVSAVPVLTLRGTSSPLIKGDTVFAAFASGRMVALSLFDGSVRWEARVAVPQGESEIERVVDVDGKLLLLQNGIYAISYQGRLTAFDPSSGRPLWYQEASSYAGMAEGFGNVYYVHADGSVVALDQRTGNIRWTNEELSNRDLSAPATFNNYVVVADFEGYIHVLSQVDGHFVGRKKIGSKGVRAPILARGDTFYVYGNKGKLAAFQVKK